MNRPPKALQPLPELSAADISAIQKLPRELRYTGLIELANWKRNGKDLTKTNMRGYVAVADYRDLMEKKPRLTRKEKREGRVFEPVSIVSLDELMSEEDGRALVDLVPDSRALDPADLVDYKRELERNEQELEQQEPVLTQYVESMIDVVNMGTRALGKTLGVSQRRVQQLVKKMHEDALAERVGTAKQMSIFEMEGV